MEWTTGNHASTCPAANTAVPLTRTNDDTYQACEQEWVVEPTDETTA